MTAFWVMLPFVVFSFGASAQTPHPNPMRFLPGIDVLAARHFDILRGKKVGLVTNQTGRARDGRATIDILRAAPNVQSHCALCARTRCARRNHSGRAR